MSLIRSSHSRISFLISLLYLDLFLRFDPFSNLRSDSKPLIRSSHSRTSFLNSLLNLDVFFRFAPFLSCLISYFDPLLRFDPFNPHLASARSDSKPSIRSSQSRIICLISSLYFDFLLRLDPFSPDLANARSDSMPLLRSLKPRISSLISLLLIKLHRFKR